MLKCRVKKGIIIKGAEEGGRKSLCGDKEQMKKTNIPSSMYSPCSKLSGDIFSGENIQRSQAGDQAEYDTALEEAALQTLCIINAVAHSKPAVAD